MASLLSRILDPIYQGALAMVGLELRPDGAARSSASFQIMAVRGAPTNAPTNLGFALNVEASGMNDLLYGYAGGVWTAAELDATAAGFTDGSNWFTTDTTQGIADAVVAAIGGTSQGVRNYTGYVLSDNQSIYASLEAIDVAYGAALSTLSTASKVLVGAISEVDGHADALATRDSGLVDVSPITKLLVDIASLRTQLTAAIADLATLKSSHDTLATKLNNDATVTDTDYAAVPALTATNPAAATATAPGASVLSQGGTAGRIKTNFDLEFSIAGRHYRKAPTDDLWNLSALGTTSGAEFKSVRLYLDASGTASVAAGTAAASSDLAKAALPAMDVSKACVGVYTMGLSGDFANALDAQGTYVDGWAVAAF